MNPKMITRLEGRTHDYNGLLLVRWNSCSSRSVENRKCVIFGTGLAGADGHGTRPIVI